MLNKHMMVTQETALEGSDIEILITKPHFVNHSDINEKRTQDQQEIIFGMGCFWGAERLFWQQDGVISTSVGYSGGFTKNPSYEQVCSGKTGHTEVVRVKFDPNVITLTRLLSLFWERHDPTQGMQQGNDSGTQYRSAIYVYDDQQLEMALTSKRQYQLELNREGNNQITTEIQLVDHYYYAEDYHQQYLAKNPAGYCGLGGTGVCFPR